MDPESEDRPEALRPWDLVVREYINRRRRVGKGSRKHAAPAGPGALTEKMAGSRVALAQLLVDYNISWD